MLYLQSDEQLSTSLHIGEANSHLSRFRDPYTTNLVQANGDELDAIRAQFTGIKDAPGCRVVVWSGEDAAFIANHIKL